MGNGDAGSILRSIPWKTPWNVPGRIPTLMARAGDTKGHQGPLKPRTDTRDDPVLPPKPPTPPGPSHPIPPHSRPGKASLVTSRPPRVSVPLLPQIPVTSPRLPWGHFPRLRPRLPVTQPRARGRGGNETEPGTATAATAVPSLPPSRPLLPPPPAPAASSRRWHRESPRGGPGATSGTRKFLRWLPEKFASSPPRRPAGVTSSGAVAKPSPGWHLGDTLGPPPLPSPPPRPAPVGNSPG